MAKFFLENDTLIVGIKQLGAELCSLIDKRTNTEHVWQGDPTVWERHAPVLFPIVGKVENDTYTIDGKSYKSGQHGFARNRDFVVESQTDSSITFLLASDSLSLEQYPYHFALRITYSLEADKLHVAYQVVNKDNQGIWFSIGAHPGFVCPFSQIEQFSDYYLEFEKPETSQRLLFGNGLLTGEKQPYLANTKQINLTHSLFDGDAIILEGLVSSWVDLKSKHSKRALRFTFKGFPLLAFWTKPKLNAPYLCIEPWYGVADTAGEGKEYKQKAYIQQLEQGGEFNSLYTVQLRHSH